MPAQKLVQRDHRDEPETASPRFLQDAERQPGQRAVIVSEVHPARRRAQRDHAVDEAQREKGEPSLGDLHAFLASQIIGQADETGRGEQEEQERLRIDDEEMKRRAREQRDKEVKRVPDEARGVAQHVVVAAEKMIRDERRLAVEQVMAQLHHERVAAIDVVVGQKKAGTPELQDEEDQRRCDQIAAERCAEARLPIASRGDIWRNHPRVLRLRGEVRKSQNGMFGIATHDLAEIIRRAGGDLETLRGAKIFVTGGTGFFGKWLLAALGHADVEMNLGLEVTVLSRDPGAFLERHPQALRWHFLAGHVADSSLPSARFDYVIHAASDTTAVSTPDEEAERTRAIVAGTARMLELARGSGARRMLYISSGAVYGSRADAEHGAREDDYSVARPTGPYAKAKRQAEKLCAASGIDFVTARAFAFLGPHLPLDAHYAAGNFIRDALRGGRIEVRGDGTALRSYLYPTDLIVWLLGILIRGKKGRAYNVGSDEVVSIAELAHVVAKAVEPHSEIVVQAVQPRGPQNIYVPDIARAKTELGLEVSVPLRESIRRTLAFHR
jgi:nucleoside-diphosphate-sugar epimerase